MQRLVSRITATEWDLSALLFGVDRCVPTKQSSCISRCGHYIYYCYGTRERTESSARRRADGLQRSDLLHDLAETAGE